MASDIRTFRFTLTVDVEPGHPAYDDPEWAADAAWGCLTNEFGLRATYTRIEEVPSSERGSVAEQAETSDVGVVAGLEEGGEALRHGRELPPR